MLLSSNYIWALSITLYNFLYHNFIQNTETKCHFTHDRHAKKNQGNEGGLNGLDSG